MVMVGMMMYNCECGGDVHIELLRPHSINDTTQHQFCKENIVYSIPVNTMLVYISRLMS